MDHLANLTIKPLNRTHNVVYYGNDDMQHKGIEAKDKESRTIVMEVTNDVRV